MRTLAFAGAHLFVLSTFALAQPLFDVLSRNAEFFAVRGSTRADVVGFALGVLLLPPAALMLVEAVALAAGILVWRAVHVVLVAALSALVLLQAIGRLADGGGVGLLVAAGLAGAAAAAAYVHVPPVRTFLTVLVPAPLVVTALFLFDSPVSRLLGATDESAAAPAVDVDARTPVVVVVFDELGTVSLLDARGRIDARRFPNFARLAADATFYRDATTVHAWTEHSVSAILTGRLPEAGQLPILADHPLNLFTLLGGAYGIRAYESHTQLCPSRFCRRAEEAETDGEDDPGFGAAGSQPLSGFASDVSIVYLHVLLPDRLAERLPPIDRSWRDFGGGGAPAAGEAEPAGAAACAPACRLVRMIDRAAVETLSFYHAPIPHPPWRYLPSGKAYVGDTQALPGLEDSVWQGDPVLTRQAYARYLLQVGATDRALGHVLDGLREQGLYDRSLVVVLADHGVSFEAGLPRRSPTFETLDDIAFVPLFVKLPNQARGRVREGFARTIDVVPTIADALDVQIPWEVDGRSLATGRPPAEGTVEVAAGEGRVVARPLSELLRARGEDLREQAATFGSGAWRSLYAVGPLGRLVGRPVDELAAPAAGDLRLELDGDALLARVDLQSQLVPAYVTGRIAGAAAGWDVVVGLNGTLAATSRTYDSLGETRFAALVPESALRPGGNRVDVFVARDGSPRALERVEASEPAFVLEDGELSRADGTPVPLATDILGTLRVRLEPGRADFGGWAADVGRARPVDAIAVFVGGRLLYTASGLSFRREEPAEEAGIAGVGFGFALPAGSLPAPEADEPVRVFALSGGRAAELAYEPDFPWRR